jgi:hypothetical protein
MSDKLMSPAVFTSENDKTYLPQGVVDISTAFIGTTKYGKAFVPTQVKSPQEFDKLFADDNISYTGYAVKSYLKNAASALVVKVLGNETSSLACYTFGGAASASFAATNPQVVLLPTYNSSASVMTGLCTTSSNQTWVLTSSAGNVTVSLADPTSPNYITKVFGQSPNSNFNTPQTITDQWYVYQLYNVGTITTTGSFNSGTLGISAGYTNATTPYITSQLNNGNSIPLFKFGTIFDGDSSNTLVKVSICDIKKPASSTEYGTFTVLVRDFTDTDLNPNVLESFTGCTLDPESINYVCARIGTQTETINNAGKVLIGGDWENKSSYIYVIPSPQLKDVQNTIVPFGHSAYTWTFISGSNMSNVLTSTSSLYTQIQGTSDTWNPRVYFGLNYSNPDVNNLSAALLTSSLGSTVYNFNLDNYSVHPSSSYATGSLSGSGVNSAFLQFTVAFQGGYDGMPFNRVRNTDENITSANAFGYNLTNMSSPGSTQFKLALNTLQNADDYDIKEYVLPGINDTDHFALTTYARTISYLRGGDCFAIIDPSGLSASIDTAIAATTSIDTNYSAGYYPWVKVIDPSTRKQRWLPTAAILPGVLAYNDRVGGEWWAPAGYNRAGIDNAKGVKDRLTKTDRDVLYNNRLNPIIYSKGKVVVFGQKTQQKKASQLDRINIRRLLIKLKKFAASTSVYLMFDPNTKATRDSFLSMVNPFLRSLVEKQGLFSFQVVMDETNNTPDVIDRNTIKGAFYIKPTPDSEYFELEFNILANGATFPNQ